MDEWRSSRYYCFSLSVGRVIFTTFIDTILLSLVASAADEYSLLMRLWRRSLRFNFVGECYLSMIANGIGWSLTHEYNHRL
jgi:hypothetical protein